MNFSDLQLEHNLLRALTEFGLETPTPIQQQAIPVIHEGKDLAACAGTGTGKTLAFLLPIMHRLAQPSEKPGKGPRLLVLVPTRELAIQVAAEATKYSKYLSRVKTVCIYGGSPYPIQNRQLARPHEILVATPGRLIDHMDSGRVDLSRVEALVLDEADRILDFGFIGPVEKIAAATPEDRQTLIFSATLTQAALRLSARLQKDPATVRAEAEQGPDCAHIEQHLLQADNLGHKRQLLDHLLSELPIDQAIIFTATKRQADALGESLRSNGLSTAVLHGDMHQRQRTQTISRMREGHIRFLVATDVAARGIDIRNVSHVINFELPTSADDYVHRIGRTGRAGAHGSALTLVTAQELPQLRRIERFTGNRLQPLTIPGLEPQLKAPRPPRQNRGRPSFQRRSYR